MLLLLNLFIFVLAFAILWYSSGLIVSRVDVFARRLRISRFFFSFFVLGVLTSLPEFAVGISAIWDKNPEIFVGNLVGGQFLLFVFVIPLLAVLGHGITLKHQFSTNHLLLALLVIATPAFLTYGGVITLADGAFIVLFYIILLNLLQPRHSIMMRLQSDMKVNASTFTTDIIRLAVGVIFVLISSKFIVDSTVFLSSSLGISAFLLSLILLAIGTNLPELSIALRAVVSGQRETAFGDYLGSACANSFLFGFLTLLNRKQVVIIGDFLVPLVFMVLGLGLFYVFSRSKKVLSRTEGAILLALYVFFIMFELIR